MEAPFPWQQRLHVALGRDARDGSCVLGHRLTDAERNKGQDAHTMDTFMYLSIYQRHACVYIDVRCPMMCMIQNPRGQAPRCSQRLGSHGGQYPKNLPSRYKVGKAQNSEDLRWLHNCWGLSVNLRPANILLDADGTPKMADFGPHLGTRVVTEIRYHCVYPCHGQAQEGLAAAVKDNGAEAPSQFGRV